MSAWCAIWRAQTGAAFVFVNYTPSPEAHYPVAIEQVVRHGRSGSPSTAPSWGSTEAGWLSPARASAAI